MVVLIALNDAGQQVEEVRLDVHEYYDEACELIDSEDYLARRGIRRVLGAIYDHKGRLDQFFENHYTELGRMTRTRSEHADGTITEQIFDT